MFWFNFGAGVNAVTDATFKYILCFGSTNSRAQDSGLGLI